MPKKIPSQKKSFSTQRFVKKSKKSFQKMPLLSMLYVSIGIVIVSFIIAFLTQSFLPPEIPLYYGLAEGIERLSPSFGLVIPSTVAFLVDFVNFSIALVIKNKFVQQTLILAGFVVSLFSLITIIKIIFLVGSFQ